MYEWIVYTINIVYETWNWEMSVVFIGCRFHVVRVRHNICTECMNGKGNWLTIVFVSFYLVCFVLFSSDRCTVFNIQVMVHKAHNIDRLILLKEKERLEIVLGFHFFLSIFYHQIVFDFKCWFGLYADFRLEMTYWLVDDEKKNLLLEWLSKTVNVCQLPVNNSRTNRNAEYWTFF